MLIISLVLAGLLWPLLVVIHLCANKCWFTGLCNLNQEHYKWKRNMHTHKHNYNVFFSILLVQFQYFLAHNLCNWSWYILLVSSLSSNKLIAPGRRNMLPWTAEEEQALRVRFLIIINRINHFSYLFDVCVLWGC